MKKTGTFFFLSQWNKPNTLCVVFFCLFSLSFGVVSLKALSVQMTLKAVRMNAHEPAFTRRAIIHKFSSFAMFVAAENVLQGCPRASALTSNASDNCKVNCGMDVQVLTNGNGARPKLGELVYLRMKSFYQGKVIFDNFASSQKPFVLALSDNESFGMGKVIPFMTVGDRWSLEVPKRDPFIMKKLQGRLKTVPDAGKVTVIVEVCGIYIPSRARSMSSDEQTLAYAVDYSTSLYSSF